MEELLRNSLLEQLVEFKTDVIEGANPLSISVNQADIKNSPFADIKNEATDPIKEPLQDSELKSVTKKRLNDFDLNILQDSALKKAQDEFSGSNVFGKMLYKYFPKIYKGFMMRKALNKLYVLNQTAGELVSKKIPYGESDQRYNALIEYLSSANTIHAKLIKKM